MPTHTVYHIASTGLDVYAYPVGQSLTDWATYRVQLTEGTGDNLSRYSGSLDDANGFEWCVFEQVAQPAWGDAVARIDIGVDVSRISGSASAAGNLELAGLAYNTSRGLAGDRLDEPVSSRATQTSVDAVPTTTEIEAALLNEGDGQQLIDAIIQVINSSLDVPALELAAIGSAVRTEIATELARIDTTISSRLASAALPVSFASGTAAAATAGATSITITGLAMDASKYAKQYLLFNEGDAVGFATEILASSTGTTFNFKDALPAAVTLNDTVAIIGKAR